jgi:predicted O-methyltransferase YrrM
MDLAAALAAAPVADASPLFIKGASRNDLPALFAARGYTHGAEIGVYKGEYAEILQRGIPNLHLLCVDRWAPYRSKKTGLTIFKSAVAAYQEARQRLTGYDCSFMKMSSLEAAALIPDGSLDFVYIDADHWFTAVIDDLRAWIPKVRKGGVIAGHDFDYKLPLDNRVRTAVTAWAEAHVIQPWYVLGRFKVRPGEHHDPELTWMWDA